MRINITKDKKIVKKEPVMVSKQALQRLPYYLNYLKRINENGVANISASTIAGDLKLYEVQVRKDLAAVSSKAGKPRVGFAVNELICDIEEFLGYNKCNVAILAGVGHLGSALLSYRGFEEYGLEIIAAFDASEELHELEIGGKKIYPVDKMQDMCTGLNIHIGIITVPAEDAQEVCDRMIKSGILAIWNFAPVHLKVPENILVQNENMAVSLAMLSKHLEGKKEV